MHNGNILIHKRTFFPLYKKICVLQAKKEGFRLPRVYRQTLDLCHSECNEES